ncbi:MAG: chromosome segregation protein SMC [Chloroflexi bacterium 44-23]|mgnify:CR=1 FL=1|nr:MAG: chromosome segregation protein SMC [Chloroflexi bacterium 44-23]
MTSLLKNLELHGYKTFASRTSFEFPGKITAIVGPNGSGKSNVADAIRWVLGEQSYRLLRGRKTEDMIFIGSEMRSRAGMASATITFDNESSWLPIDFSEVSVTRRAYRDGQNEYLLNGQKIRLRDIQELFAQSGLAERTYTLIGQGLVDTALSARPDERRKFFEEAAGIGLYRSRREEAVNRLDQTRRNLERVRDILSELEPRLKSLERQARRYIEYKTIQADLQVLLREWYGFHWHNGQQELSQAKLLLKERESNLAGERETYEKFDREISALRKDLHEIRTQLNDWHLVSSAHHQTREQISKELAVMDERQRSMLTQRQNGLSDMVKIEEELNDHVRTLENLKIDFEQLKLDFNEASAQVKIFENTVNTRLAEREKITQDIRSVRRDLVQHQTKLVELRARKDEIEERIKSNQQNLAKIEMDQKTAEKSVVEAKSIFDKAQARGHSEEHDRDQIEKRISELSTIVSKLEEENKKSQKESNQLQSEQARLIAQIEVVEQAEASLSGLNIGTKTIMEAAKSGQLNGKFRPLSGFLDVPKQYEPAVSAALGEFIEAIVIIDGSNPSAMIDLLTVSENGRAVILPVNQLRQAKNEILPQGPGVIGVAQELFQWEKEIDPVMQMLLANTVFVEDSRNALRLVDKLPVNARMVTLRGEIFFGSGAVVAGKENRSSIISRPRQKKELQTALEIVQTALSQLQKKQLKRDEKLEENLNELKKERLILQSYDQDAQERLKTVHRANLVFEQSRQKNEYLLNQAESLRNQLKQADQTIAQLKLEIEANQGAVIELEGKIRLLNESLSELPLDEFQAELNYARTNAAVAERSVSEAKKRLFEFEQLLQQGHQRRLSLQRRSEDLQIALEEVDEQKAAFRLQEEQIQTKIEELQIKIKPAEKKLVEIESFYAALQEEQANAQQAVSIAERYYAQSQLDFSRHKDALSNLQRRIEEDFGLVAFEYSDSMSGPNPLPFDGLVEQLPNVKALDATLENSIGRQRAHLRRIGPINPDANEEYSAVKNRFEFMTTQVEDLKKADEDLRQVINELDSLMQREFKKTFDAVAIEFKDMFTQLFGGGTARLILTDEENFNNSGVDIEARLPGRREQGLSLLSGGERSLTAVALIFALLKVSPTPFCVLDEVDAALDESNVGRFCDLLAQLSQKIQFIVITHNRNTVQVADVIYGITMGRDSTSQMISLRLDEVDEEMVR